MTRPMADWLVSEGIVHGKISIINNFVDVKSICSSATHERSRGDLTLSLVTKFITVKRNELILNSHKAAENASACR